MKNIISTIQEMERKSRSFLFAAICSFAVAGVAFGESIYTDAGGVEYIAVEYLESSGGQYIDTGYIHNERTVVDIKAAITVQPNSSTWYAYYGGRTNNGDSRSLGAWVHGNHHYSGVGTPENELSGWTYTVNTPFFIHLDASTNSLCYINGQSFTRGTVEMWSDFGHTDYLFAMNNNGTAGFQSKARIYWCVVREDEVAMRDFVPVKRRSDNKPGMLDRVAGKFYVNSGSGELTAGPVLASAPVVAAWTGAANNGEISDAANWSCTDPSGAALSGVVPDESTRTIILEADADWRGSSGALSSHAATIDLNGHELKVATIPDVLLIVDYYGEYELLEYLESANAGGESPVIDTHLRGSATTKADLKVAFTRLPAPNGWYAYIGGRSNAGVAEQFSGWIHNNNGNVYHWSGMTASEGDVAALGKVAVNTPFTVHLDNASGAMSTVNGGDLVAGNGQTLQKNILLFTCADGRYYKNRHDIYGRRSYVADDFTGTCRIYFCKLWTGDVLERDFVPVRRVSDGALGMLDRTSWKFYGNAAFYGKDFVGGSATNTLVHGTAAGRLVVDTASGTVENKYTGLSGALKLVKEGAGTLLLSAQRQSYFGGTEIVAGTLKGGADHNRKFPLGAAKSSIVVNSGATYDINGLYYEYNNKGKYKFILDGGVLANNGSDLANYLAQMTDVVLTKNATISASRSFALVGDGYSATSIELGGNTLNVAIGTGKYFVCSNTSATNGTISTSGDGWFGLGSDQSESKGGTFKGRNLNFVVNSGLGVYENATIRNYEPRYNGDRNLGSKTLNVTGSFKPVGSGFYAPVMKNNSTLDLSGWDPAGTLGWPIYSRSTAGNVQLSFANNATIAVNLKDRADLFKLAREKTYLFKWGTSNETRTTRPENTVFKVDDYSSSRYIYLEQDDVGLKVMRHGGLTIRIY
jgi:autotransporter-associated beta strand protein